MTVAEITNINSGTSSQNAWTTAPFDVAAGDLIVVAVGGHAPSAAPSGVADSLSNAYALGISSSRSTVINEQMWFFYYPTAQTGITLTVTYGATTSLRLGKVIRVNNTPNSSQPDTTSAGGTGGVAKIGVGGLSASPLPGSFTPSHADEILVCVAWANAVAPTATPAGYTIVGSDLLNSLRSSSMTVYHKTQGATGAENPGFTLSQSKEWAIGQIGLGAVLAPVNTTPPVLTGIPAPGETLSTDNGAWTNTPLSYAYQVQRETGLGTGVYADVSGQTAATYVLGVADADRKIRYKVTASNASGAGSPAFSNAIGPIAGQVLRPVAILSAAAWSNDDGSTPPTIDRINEVVPNDANYLRSSLSPITGDELKVRLGPGAPPATPRPDSRFIIRLHEMKDVTGGDTINLTVTMYRADGTTVVKSQAYNNIDPLSEQSFSLTGTQADTIPDADFGTGLVIGLSAIKV